MISRLQPFSTQVTSGGESVGVGYGGPCSLKRRERPPSGIDRCVGQCVSVEPGTSRSSTRFLGDQQRRGARRRQNRKKKCTGTSKFVFNLKNCPLNFFIILLSTV